MSSMRSITWATLAKDIRLEWRSKDALNSMLFNTARVIGPFFAAVLLTVLEPGYCLHGRVLRPAKVVVAGSGTIP